LLRSVFFKGIAASVVESMTAAEKLGLGHWLREQLGSVLADDALIDRFIEGSKRHASRRTNEMDAARKMVQELGVTPHIATAAMNQLADLAEQGTAKANGKETV
jgi:3-hydroxyisobutyrate dehydrogenase-like beta-hydroxyacid dehydrogenase